MEDNEKVEIKLNDADNMVGRFMSWNSFGEILRHLDYLRDEETLGKIRVTNKGIEYLTD